MRALFFHSVQENNMKIILILVVLLSLALVIFLGYQSFKMLRQVQKQAKEERNQNKRLK
jgi:preprotein translocase subunit YajC